MNYPESQVCQSDTIPQCQCSIYMLVESQSVCEPRHLASQGERECEKASRWDVNWWVKTARSNRRGRDRRIEDSPYIYKCMQRYRGLEHEAWGEQAMVTHGTCGVKSWKVRLASWMGLECESCSHGRWAAFCSAEGLKVPASHLADVSSSPMTPGFVKFTHKKSHQHNG